MSRTIVSSRRDVVHELKKLGLDAMKLVLAAESRGLQIMVDTFPTMIIVNNTVTDGQARAYPNGGSKWTVAGSDSEAIAFLKEFVVGSRK